MLTCCRTVPAAPAATGRNARLGLVAGEDKSTKQTAALDTFDRLCIREVRAENEDTASAFLAKFQSTAASLGPEERIELEVCYTQDSMELLKVVLSDPQDSKVCALRWAYNGEEDMNLIIPLLTNNCPELASLEIRGSSAFDFVSSVIEHPRNKIKVLTTPEYTEGDLARFFAALGRSQVSAFSITSCHSPAFYQGLCEYLAKDLLARLKVMGEYKQAPWEMMMSLANCTCLAKLEMFECVFSQPTAFPQSITKLVLHGCTFVGGVDWSFLADGNVRELNLHGVEGVDGNQLGGILAVHLKARGLDELSIYSCGFVNETLAAVGGEIGRVKRLHISSLNDASFELIVFALQSPSSKIKELRLEYYWNTMSSVEGLVVPALRHPNCILAKLRFWADEEHEKAAKAMEDRFHNRRALFALLQGQQVRRKRLCPLRRLPVEMFRLVGLTLSQ